VEDPKADKKEKPNERMPQAPPPQEDANLNNEPPLKRQKKTVNWALAKPESFKVLGIQDPSNTTESQVQRHFRAASLKHHPDKAGLVNDDGKQGQQQGKDFHSIVQARQDLLSSMTGPAAPPAAAASSSSSSSAVNPNWGSKVIVMEDERLAKINRNQENDYLDIMKEPTPIKTEENVQFMFKRSDQPARERNILDDMFSQNINPAEQAKLEHQNQKQLAAEVKRQEKKMMNEMLKSDLIQLPKLFSSTPSVSQSAGGIESQLRAGQADSLQFNSVQMESWKRQDELGKKKSQEDGDDEEEMDEEEEDADQEEEELRRKLNNPLPKEETPQEELLQQQNSLLDESISDFRPINPLDEFLDEEEEEDKPMDSRNIENESKPKSKKRVRKEVISHPDEGKLVPNNVNPNNHILTPDDPASQIKPETTPRTDESHLNNDKQKTVSVARLGFGSHEVIPATAVEATVIKGLFTQAASPSPTNNDTPGFIQQSLQQQSHFDGGEDNKGSHDKEDSVGDDDLLFPSPMKEGNHNPLFPSPMKEGNHNARSQSLFPSPMKEGNHIADANNVFPSPMKEGNHATSQSQFKPVAKPASAPININIPKDLLKLPVEGVAGGGRSVQLSRPFGGQFGTQGASSSSSSAFTRIQPRQSQFGGHSSSQSQIGSSVNGFGQAVPKPLAPAFNAPVSKPLAPAFDAPKPVVPAFNAPIHNYKPVPEDFSAPKPVTPMFKTPIEPSFHTHVPVFGDCNTHVPLFGDCNIPQVPDPALLYAPAPTFQAPVPVLNPPPQPKSSSCANVTNNNQTFQQPPRKGNTSNRSNKSNSNKGKGKSGGKSNRNSTLKSYNKSTNRNNRIPAYKLEQMQEFAQNGWGMGHYQVPKDHVMTGNDGWVKKN